MRKIKIVLGLVLAITICALGLASCGKQSNVEYIDSKTGEAKSVSGEIYATTKTMSLTGFEIENQPSYIFLSADGKVYYGSFDENSEKGYRFNMDGSTVTWEQLKDDMIRVGNRTYLKVDKYLIQIGAQAVLIRVDGTENANK